MTNLSYLTASGTPIVAPNGNTDNGGGEGGSVAATTFDGSALLKYKMKSWMTCTAGGGGITYFDGASRTLFQAGVELHPFPQLYFDTDYIRIPEVPTQQAATFDLAAQGFQSTFDWYPQKWQIHVDASELKYTDGNLQQTQNADVIRWFSDRAVRFGAGYTGGHFTFSHVLLDGYFSPDTYQDQNCSGLLQIRYHHAFTGEYRANLGAESISGLPFRRIYEISTSNTLHLGNFDLHGDYTHFHFTQATGAFQTDLGTIGMKYKF